jgi:hypothetical protein
MREMISMEVSERIDVTGHADGLKHQCLGLSDALEKYESAEEQKSVMPHLEQIRGLLSI